MLTADLEDTDGAQSDLMGNMLVIQNNAHLTANNTIETRQNLVRLFDAPPGRRFTGISTLIGNRLFAACDDKTIRYATLHEGSPVVMGSTVVVTDNDGETGKDNTWTFLGYADDQLVGMTQGKQLWTGDPATPAIANARPIPDSGVGNVVPKMLFSQLTQIGTVTIRQTADAAHPFRIGITYTYLNKFGPTRAPAILEFYANKPTSEWSGAGYVRISGPARPAANSLPSGYAITAVELYYTEGESKDPAFLSRVTNIGSNGAWQYNWMGYLFDTSMWSLANLTIPSENYTAGVPASKMASHDGQLYFWGGTPEHRVWIGGNPGNRFSISPGTGGGWVDVEPGTGLKVRNVLKFKTQQGASIVTLLCDSENSQKEYRFNLVENNISISNEQSLKGWQAEKIAGTVGCKSYNGAIVANDGLYAVSRYGLAITTLTMEYNSQLQVQYVSDPIEPVFTKQYGNQLRLATLFAVNDVLYMTFGSPDGDLDNVIFCYDIGSKAWWTHTIDVDKPILNMLHIDHQDTREGIGIITEDHIYLLPTTRDQDRTVLPIHEVLLETPELAVTQPIQGMQHLTQLEFCFDYFIGDMDIEVVMIDQFGRKVHVLKKIRHSEMQYKLSEYVRIDKVVSSYKVSMKGKANMRLTHFMSKSYPKSNRIGVVWGFDSRQSHTSPGSIHHTFADYNDVKKAIIP